MNVQMKYDPKSFRVKACSFHPTRPWLLAALHDGTVELHDYLNKILVATFECHSGPVRGVDFHSSQPLFVTCGDDALIKVWNYQTRRCLFTFTGHKDYVRAVQFHKELPWIVSCSDDHSVRIWNWQSRQLVYVLSGHNHYVMSACFHPTKPLVLSASLDETARVWDIAPLVSQRLMSGSIKGQSSGDMFGEEFVRARFILSGHLRGVNWASFHPTQNLIATGADDHNVKLWRYNETRCVEESTFYGHVKNVSSVEFDPRSDRLISNSEDNTIRIWDLSKQAPTVTLRRDGCRFWVLSVHPTNNLIAAGHDRGLQVFKMGRERPLYDSVNAKQTVFVADKMLYLHGESKSSTPQHLTSLPREVARETTHSLHYNRANRAEHCVLINSDPAAVLLRVPKNNPSQAQPVIRLKNSRGVFVSRARIAVLQSGTVSLVGLDGVTKKALRMPAGFVPDEIFSAGIGRLLLRSQKTLALYDVHELKVTHQLALSKRTKFKYVKWSPDRRYIAMWSRCVLVITDARLQEMCRVTENTRVKTGLWDDAGCFVYTTLSHMKYLLPTGDQGVVQSLPHPLYLVSLSHSGHVLAMDRQEQLVSLNVDLTECRFKVALERRKKSVLKIIKDKKLPGKAIVSYLRRKGFPDVALNFVTDDHMRFKLGLECCDIEVALQCAGRLNDPECWRRLGQEALRQGNHKVVEAACQKTRDLERLSFLYLITGNTENLRRMLVIAKARTDTSSRFHNALFLGDVKERFQVLVDSGQYALALLTARTHNLHQEFDELKARLGPNCPSLPDPESKETPALLYPPAPVLRQTNWPLLDLRKGFFDEEEREDEVEALAEGKMDDYDDEFGMGVVTDTSNIGSGWGVDETEGGEAGGDGGDMWGELDIDFEKDAEVDKDVDEDLGFVYPVEGKSPSHGWADSLLAGDLVAAGAFSQAMHALNRQVGCRDFELLRPYFLKVWTACRVSVPGLPDLSKPLTTFARRQPDGEQKRVPGSSTDRPSLPFSLKQCVALLKRGYQLFKESKLGEAESQFAAVIRTLLFISVASDEVDAVLELRSVCTQYLLAIRAEKVRRTLDPKTEPERVCELLAVFAHCQLQPVHAMLGIRLATKTAYTLGNYRLAGHFCRRVIELGLKEKAIAAKLLNFKRLKGVLRVCEQKNTDAHPIEYDPTAVFSVCAGSLRVIAKRQDAIACSYCQSHFFEKFDGQTCVNCGVGTVGGNATGLKVSVDQK